MTKSIQHAHFEHWTIDYEDDADRYLEAVGESKYHCIMISGERYYNERDRELCYHARDLRGQNRVEKQAVVSSTMGPFLMDVLFGFAAPFILVFFLLPTAWATAKAALAAAKAYLKWVTEEPK